MIESYSSEKAPKAVGPYSQAVRAGDLLFISGQLPLDPSTMQIIAANTPEQARLVLNHLKAILEAAGLTLERVVKVEVFLDDINDFKAVNAVYAEFFKHHPMPARQAFEVSKLPLGAKVEISCIAAF